MISRWGGQRTRCVVFLCCLQKPLHRTMQSANTQIMLNGHYSNNTTLSSCGRSRAVYLFSEIIRMQASITGMNYIRRGRNAISTRRTPITYTNTVKTHLCGSAVRFRRTQQPKTHSQLLITQNNIDVSAALTRTQTASNSVFDRYPSKRGQYITHKHTESI